MNDNSPIALVNTTSNEKHCLNEPEYVIGRGWLECNDKRISRNHGILRVSTRNSVAVISTHQNCMFYRKKNNEIVNQIQKDDEVQLYNGDFFGLLVDEFWFEVQCLTAEDGLVLPSHENGIQSNGDALQMPSTGAVKRRPSSDSEPDSTNKKVKTEPNEFQTDDVAPAAPEAPKAPTVPNESNAEANQDMDVTTNIEAIAMNNGISNEMADNEMPSTSTALLQDIPENVSTGDQSTTTPNVRIKTEPLDSNENEAQSVAVGAINQPIKQEPWNDFENVGSTDNNVVLPFVAVKTEVKQEPSDNEATTSSGTASSSNPSTQRPCCRYGVRCYRRNRLHRMQEAHPGDSDYRLPDYPPPPLGAPTCPYLDRCYRRNPVHFQQFSHTLGTKQTGKDGYEATAKQTTRTQTTTNDHLSDDDPDSDNDDEEEDPYASNSEDDPDYEPSNSQIQTEDTDPFDADTDHDVDDG